jgi:hypothetical protein
MEYPAVDFFGLPFFDPLSLLPELVVSLDDTCRERERNGRERERERERLIMIL